ncbi:MAG: hypothetical protein ACI97A_000524 [Planctomycetota bacterium]|jgi:hypothetical protein
MNRPEPDVSISSFDPSHFSTFVFDRVSDFGQGLRFHYRISGEGHDGLEFTEEIHFEGHRDSLCEEQEAVLENLSSLLFQVAGTSYYKTAAPPTLTLPSGTAGPDRIAFLTTLVKKGLAEFANVNNLDLSAIRFLPCPGRPSESQYVVPESNKVLVPFGGGKDSLLSLQLVVEAGFNPTLFVVGPNPVAEGLAEKTGHPLIRVRRVLDPKIGMLNTVGAYNGHIPVTAVVSMIAVLVAVRDGFSAVVMSNENSANKGTMLDGGAKEVNHQFSKGLEFEAMLRDQIHRCGLRGMDYFSLLRPFSELSICREFARRGNHFGEFVSCNGNFRRSQTDARPHWCMECSKCLFVHLSMAPFLTEDDMFLIFGANPLGDVARFSTYEALIEFNGAQRPFDCVGGPEESRAAFALLLDHPVAKSYLAVKAFKEKWGPSLPTVDVVSELASSEDHLVPERFLGAVHAVR